MFILAQQDMWSQLTTPGNIAKAVRIFALVVIGFPLLFFAASVISKKMKKRFSPQSAMLVSKGVFYTGCVILIVTILFLLEFPLTAFLGAAGVVGIAIGFASQTSVSNIISGLFLISEKPFAVGDIIKVGQTTGIVLSIDLLSVKLRQFDNRFVRLPNELLIKTEVVNVTRFPIRRMDIKVGVAYKENVARIREVLLDVAAKTPYCLDEPEPLVRFVNFGDSALEFLFCVWCVKEEYLQLQNVIMQSIKERFDEEGIEIPFPHHSIYAGSVTDPFPIRLVDSEGQSEKTGE